MPEESSGGLRDTLNALREHLATLTTARAEFQAETRLVEGVRTEAKIRQFTLTIDEPPQLGGSDQGPNPVELVLAALGTCQEIVYAAFAAVLGIPLERLSIRVEGALDPRGLFAVAEVPAGLTEIRFTVELDTPASAAQVEELRRLVNAHCPVLATLTEPARIASAFLWNGQPLADEVFSNP